MFDFESHLLTYPQLLEVALADRASITSWMRAGHLRPALDEDGRERRFSLRNLVEVDSLYHLRRVFNLQIGIASHLANAGLDQYAPQAMTEFCSIAQYRKKPGEAALRIQYTLIRTPDGELRLYEPGDAPSELGVDVIFPLGLTAALAFSRFIEKFAQ